MSTTISYTFTESSNYTFSTSLVEVSSGLRLKDLRPENATFFASYNIDENYNWGDGSSSGVLNGGAVVSSGLLDCSGSTSPRYWSCSATGNANSAQTGCFNVRFYTNYAGAPTENNFIFSNNKGDGSLNNVIQAAHLAAGNILLSIYDNTGAAITNVTLSTWSPTTSVLNELEVNYDLETGASRLFLGGELQGAVQTSTGTRTSTEISNLYLGSGSVATELNDNIYDQIAVYSEVQHTSSYVIGSTISPTVYTTSAPSVLFNTTFYTDELIGFVETATKTTNDEMKYTISLDSTYYYHDGSSWALSTNTSTEANTATDINTNATSLFDVNGNLRAGVQINSFVLSENGDTTPDVSQVVITPGFVGGSPTMTFHTYYGYLKQIDNTNLTGKTIQVRIDETVNDLTLMNADYITTTVRFDGYWEIDVYWESVQPNRLYWYVDNKKYITNFSTATNKFSELRQLRG